MGSDWLASNSRLPVTPTDSCALVTLASESLAPAPWFGACARRVGFSPGPPGLARSSTTYVRPPTALYASPDPSRSLPSAGGLENSPRNSRVFLPLTIVGGIRISKSPWMAAVRRAVAASCAGTSKRFVSWANAPGAKRSATVSAAAAEDVFVRPMRAPVILRHCDGSIGNDGRDADYLRWRARDSACPAAGSACHRLPDAPRSQRSFEAHRRMSQHVRRGRSR